MKYKPLLAYLFITLLLSVGFIALMKMLGERGVLLISFYMFFPAIAGIITRVFFYEQKFKDASLRIGGIKSYLTFWGASLRIALFSFVIFTLLNAIKWDFSGQLFLSQLQVGVTHFDWLSPQMVLVLYFIGGLTIFNILPGIIIGFGEEFGWRGFMFPELYKIKPWVAFIIGGLIWYAWHAPLAFVFPTTQNLTIIQTILNVVILGVGSICTHTFLAYVYVKSENIWVTSVAHVTLNNVGRAVGYFAVIQNQLLANLGLTITMLIVVISLYFSKKWKIFEDYFSNAH